MEDVLQNDTESATRCISKAMMRQDNAKDFEAEPLVWTPSSNYGTEDNGTESSIVNEPTESMPKRQIGVVSAVFIIFNRLIGTG